MTNFIENLDPDIAPSVSFLLMPVSLVRVCVCIHGYVVWRLEGMRVFHAVCLLILAQFNEKNSSTYCAHLFVYISLNKSFFLWGNSANSCPAMLGAPISTFYIYFFYALLSKAKVDKYGFTYFCVCVYVCLCLLAQYPISH